MGAYEDLMKSVDDRVKSGAQDRDNAADEKKRKEAERVAREAETARRAKEAAGATGARVREGYTRMQELRDAAARELKAPKKKYNERKGPSGGVRG